MIYRTLKISLVALAAIAASASYAQTALVPGATVANPILAGSFFSDYSPVADQLESFSAVDGLSNTVFTGLLFSYVYSNNTTGNLAFIYVVANNNDSPGNINRLSVTGYSGYDLSVVQDPNDTATPNINSFTASRSTSGDAVSFDWKNVDSDYAEIAPGVEGSADIVYTTSKEYTQNGVATIGDRFTTSVGTFAPIPVPEPSSILALGGALIVLARRRKR